MRTNVAHKSIAPISQVLNFLDILWNGFIHYDFMRFKVKYQDFLRRETKLGTKSKNTMYNEIFHGKNFNAAIFKIGE